MSSKRPVKIGLAAMIHGLRSVRRGMVGFFASSTWPIRNRPASSSSLRTNWQAKR